MVAPTTAIAQWLAAGTRVRPGHQADVARSVEAAVDRRLRWKTYIASMTVTACDG